MSTKNKRIKKQEHDPYDGCSFEEKQKMLEDIIKSRSLIRPKTKIITVLTWILAYLLLSFFISTMVIYALQVTKYKWLLYLFSYIIFGFLFSKKICIKAIECYQHYAKDETRRRCICVPSCSEYSISALKKYNIFKALNKIRIRLFKTCRGGFGYISDEP